MLDPEHFLDFVKSGDVGRLDKLLASEQGVDINWKDQDGRTALHHAVIHGHVDCARRLVEYGCDVNIKDETLERRSSLHEALLRRQIQNVQIIMGAPGFDVTACDSAMSKCMFPRVCHIDDSCSTSSGNMDSMERSSTLSSKGKDLDEQSMLVVRDEAVPFLQNNFPTNRAEIRELIVIQDRSLCEITDVTFQVDLMALTSLYIVDCNLYLDEDSEVFNSLPLQTLVLTKNKIETLPASLFSLEYLEVLIVNENCLRYVPTQVANLTNLRVFCCDRQTPRLDALPHSLTRLVNLEVLSFNDNNVEHISWVTAMKSLRTLSCRGNAITKLPELSALKELTVLDVSQNFLTHVPMTMYHVITRLVKFHYYCPTLRPRHIQHDSRQLCAHLELQHVLQETPNGTGVVKDVNIVFVGERNSGKTSLIDALSDEKCLSKEEIKHKNQFEMRHFQLPENGHSFLASTMTFSGDYMDPYCLSHPLADVYVLTMDISRFDLSGESMHKAIRHIQRMQLWLQMLYEISPETPVIIAGTHADSVKASQTKEIWRFIQLGLLETLRQQHSHAYDGATMKNCILCNSPDLAVRKHHVKSKSEMGGIVDLDLHSSDIKESSEKVSFQEKSIGTKFTCPHIIGYYEVDSKRTMPKELKKVNWTMECLRTAIARAAGRKCTQSIPSAWLSLIKHILSVNKERPDLPCMPYDELETIAKRLEIQANHTPLLVQYFHERGKILHFKGHKKLEQLAVIKPEWLIRKIQMLLSNADCSMYYRDELLDLLADEEIDKLLLGNCSIQTSAAEWLLLAFEKLNLCVPCSEDAQRYAIPLLLEIGDPNLEAWPEMPDWEEKQVIYELPVQLSTLEPAQFGTFVIRTLFYEKENLQIVTNPPPVILSSHFVFFTELDRGRCSDCLNLQSHTNSGADDMIQRVHIHMLQSWDRIQITVRGKHPCCIIKTITSHVEKQFSVHVEDSESKSCPPSTSTVRKAKSSTSLRERYTSNHIDCTEKYSILCPKCVLLRSPNPDKFSRSEITGKRKAICKRWHNLGSWSRALTGDYHITPSSSFSLASMLDCGAPRLLMVLPPTIGTTVKEWLLYSKTNFMDDFELHILCECPNAWHFAGENGFRLGRSKEFEKMVGNPINTIINASLSVIQVINSVQEHPENAMAVCEVIADLIKSFEYFRSIDPGISDPLMWLRKNKTKVVSYLSSVISNATDKIPDLYFRVSAGASAEALFRSPPPVNKQVLARFLRVDCKGGRFGTLRPLKIHGQVRWLCDMHFEEMRLGAQ